jgi:hypothetical protein
MAIAAPATASAPAPADQKIMDKIAKLHIAGVRDEDICDVMGMEPEVLESVFLHAEFKRLLGRLTIEKLEQDELLNGGWDTVEALAVNAVIKNLSLMPDPKYALAAAQVANKAQRRSSVAPKLITPQNGQRFQIRLEQIFVNGMQGGLITDAATPALNLRPAKAEPRKQQDFLPLNKVEELLTVPEPALPAPEPGTSRTISSAILAEVRAPDVLERFVYDGEFDAPESADAE